MKIENYLVKRLNEIYLGQPIMDRALARFTVGSIRVEGTTNTNMWVIFSESVDVPSGRRLILHLSDHLPQIVRHQDYQI